MIDRRPDAELRERFQQLRSEEREAAPDFAALLGRVRADLDEPGKAAPGSSASQRGARPRPRWLWAGGSVAAAAGIGALAFFGLHGRADREFERTVRSYASVSAGWRLPTDALLELPGSELMKAVPRVGTGWPGDGGVARRARS